MAARMTYSQVWHSACVRQRFASHFSGTHRFAPCRLFSGGEGACLKTGGGTLAVILLNVSHRVRRNSSSGVIGDPTHASTELGAKLLCSAEHQHAANACCLVLSVHVSRVGHRQLAIFGARHIRR